MSTVHVGLAYHFADCLFVIGHFAEYYFEAYDLIGHKDRRARVDSLFVETR